MDKLRKIMVLTIILLFIGIVSISPIVTKIVLSQDQIELEIGFLNSPQTPPTDREIVDRNNLPKSTVLIDEVPTSEWTYGCVPTTTGMLFGYYDRTGYPNMYTGPTNGGICPLTDLQQCYIIATEQGLDGITTNGHVDDYYISLNSPGPDPWEGNWPEHTWDLCTADFIGTSQWKWDYNLDSSIESNTDASTMSIYNPDGSKLYDHIPSADYGLPQTATCHGCKLFVESRGYTVDSNYVQLTDTPMGHPSGFTFTQFQAEINADRPVITHWKSTAGYGHVMLGVGYDSSTSTIYFHDTWDNNLHSTTWTGTYSSYDFEFFCVTVIQLEENEDLPPTAYFTWSDADGSGPGTIINFDASGSTDDNGIISYEWDWDNDAIFDYTGGPTTTYDYGDTNIHIVTLRVTDTLSQTNIFSDSSVQANDGGGAILDVDQSTFDRGFPIRHAIDGDWAAAQNFKANLDTLAKVDIYLRKFGTPEFDLTVELREDHPQGPFLDAIVFEPEEVSSSWAWLSIDFTDITTNPITDFFIVCPPAPSGVTTSFGYEWGYAFGNQYEDGAFWFTRDGGELWRDLPTMYEFVFRTYGYN